VTVARAGDAAPGLAPPVSGPRPGPLLGGDGLRGLACLLVFWLHAAEGSAVANHVGLVQAFGPLGALLMHLDFGLYIFFVLSGYLVGRPWIRAVLDNRPLPRPGSYARHRFLRIVPAFWGIATLVLLRHLLLPSFFPASLYLVHAERIPATYLFLQTYFPTALSGSIGGGWSLHPEVGFYVLLPLAALVLAGLAARPWWSGPARVALVLGVIGVVFALSLFSRLVTPDTLPWRRSILEMLWAFTPGLLLAAVEPFLAPRLVGRGMGRLVAAGLLTLGVAMLLLNAAIPNRNALNADLDLWRSVSRAVGAGSVVAAPVLLQWATGSCWAFLAAGPLRWLGVRAYSFYLLHEAVGLELAGVVGRLGAWRSLALQLVLTLPAAVILAALSYRWLERPFLQLKGPATR
jgi:peptidoglycan/LPS O-acetylase OafA/YrhL